MTGKEYRIRFILGDWSKDGHERTSSHLYVSNYSHGDIKKAVTKTEKKLGFKFSSIASDYEDSSINVSNIVKLYDLIEVKDDSHIVRRLSEDELINQDTCEILESSLDESFSLDEDSFIELYWLMAKYSLSDVYLDPADESDVTEVNLGGYGLF